MDRIETLKNALLFAGDTILSFDPKTISTSTKTTAGDFVTDADIASEKIIIKTILTDFPSDVVISEETTSSHHLLSEENLPKFTGWVIDPIDGTNNFKRGMQYSGISIGYIVEGKIEYGGIYDPFTKSLYLAEKGKGATKNGISISVSEIEEFNAGTRVCTSNSYEAGGTSANMARYEQLGHVWVDVLSSAVLIMADVASSKLDLYHHNGLKPWDNAAGFLIATEAGAKIVGLEGETINWLSPSVVMGNPRLVDLFVTLTNQKITKH